MNWKKQTGSENTIRSGMIYMNCFRN